MRAIDLNCDMGEGCANDAELMTFVSSANIACGSHAGDIDTMKRTVELALVNGVAIGAHPGYPDREGFGRKPMSLSPKEVFAIVQEQIARLIGVCDELGAALHHVKPHGALYNQAAKDRELAASIAEAVRGIDVALVLYGLSGSALIHEGKAAGLMTASEVFADRTYSPDGTLTPRSEPGALITDLEQSILQIFQMIELGTVASTSGENIAIESATICVHGDGPNAVMLASSVRTALTTKGIRIQTV